MLPGAADALPDASSTTPTSTRYDLSSLRLAVTGAAAVPVELIRRMRDELDVRDDHHRLRAHRVDAASPRCAATTTIPRPSPRRRAGPSRTSRCASSTSDGDDAARRRAGRGGRARLQRDDGLLRRPRGDRRGHRRRRLAAHRRHRRRWTSAGNLRITDRTKDMFIVGGFNAYPAEIENLMLRQPGHRPGRRRRRARRAPGRGRHGVRRARGRGATVDRRRAHRVVPRARWPTTRCPRHVEVVDALPLNATGKVLKYELRKEAAR